MKIDFNKKVTISAQVDTNYCRSMLNIAGFSTRDKSDDEVINDAISLISAYGFDIVDTTIADNKTVSDEKPSTVNACDDLPVI